MQRICHDSRNFKVVMTEMVQMTQMTPLFSYSLPKRVFSEWHRNLQQSHAQVISRSTMPTNSFKFRLITHME